MAVDLNRIQNSPFAIVVWYIQEGKDDEAKVYNCLATWNSMTESVDVYRPESDKPALVLNGEQLDRINVVTEDMKSLLLNADYGISLTMSNIPNNDTEVLDWTGLKW